MPVYEISFTILNFILVNTAVDDNFLACWRLVFKMASKIRRNVIMELTFLEQRVEMTVYAKSLLNKIEIQS